MISTTFTVYTMPTEWQPIPEIGDWPLDHVGIAASDGTEWGCFGRKPSEEPTARRLIEGKGNLLWASEIAGAAGSADITHRFTGICHQCANRILIPTGMDVQLAPGNEIATPLFGKYGLNVGDLVTLVKDAARRANKIKPFSVSDFQINEAVNRIAGGLNEEWKIIERDIDEVLKPKVPDLSVDAIAIIKELYFALYHRRAALYGSYKLGKITAEHCISRLRDSFIRTLEDIQDLTGPLKFRQIFPMPISLAAKYVFNQPLAK